MTKRNMVLVLAGCFLLAETSVVLAQEPAPMGPPKILQIYREEVKPGKVAAHEKVEAGWPRAFAAAKWPTHYLGMVSLTGPNEAWFVTGFDSLAAWEKDQRDAQKNVALQTNLDRLSAQDGELLSGLRSLTAAYRSDLSYRAEGVTIGTMRYFYVTTYRIRPGHENDFIEATKLVRAAHEKANVPEHWAVFEVMSGMPGPTYLIFQPLKSLAEVDGFPQTHGQAFRDAIGDEGRKKLADLASAATISREVNILAFNPKMSYVSKETASADPEFWTPKPKPSPAPQKQAGKPGGQH